jgi:hypothetical protein
MNAANSGEPARGVVVGPLKESHPDRIVVGTSTLYLPEGVSCIHPVGTPWCDLHHRARRAQTRGVAGTDGRVAGHRIEGVLVPDPDGRRESEAN